MKYNNSHVLNSLFQLFRHGARTPMYKYVFDPFQDFDYGIEGLGQLTGVGFRYNFVPFFV